MNERERNLREERTAHFTTMSAIMEKINAGTSTAEDGIAFDNAERGMKFTEAELKAMGVNPESVPGASAEDIAAADGRGLATRQTPSSDSELRSGDKYSDWLKEHHDFLSRNIQAKEDRIGSWPKEWDEESTAKYWRGMTTGDWHNAEAEHRAAMAEGTNATGGFLVPSPVFGGYVDLLRDAVVFMQGQSHTIPWNGPGKTMAVPVAVTDIQVQNLAEATGDLYPPATDVTVGQYLLTARPYASVESWSWELEEDSQIPIPEIVSRSFAQRMARAVQIDFIYGSGATFINGFSSAAGLVVQFEGGASPPALPTAAAGKAWTAVDAAITATRTLKANTDTIVTSPLCYSKYAQLQNTLFDAIRPTPTVQRYIDGEGGPNHDGAFYLTTAIKDNLTVGADVTDVSDMYFLWSDFFYWGIKHSMSVLPLRERLATQRLNGAVAWLRLDAFLAHAEAQVRLQVKTS